MSPIPTAAENSLVDRLLQILDSTWRDINKWKSNLDLTVGVGELLEEHDLNSFARRFRKKLVIGQKKIPVLCRHFSNESLSKCSRTR